MPYSNFSEIDFGECVKQSRPKTIKRPAFQNPGIFTSGVIQFGLIHLPGELRVRRCFDMILANLIRPKYSILVKLHGDDFDGLRAGSSSQYFICAFFNIKLTRRDILEIQDL